VGKPLFGPLPAATARDEAPTESSIASTTIFEPSTYWTSNIGRMPTARA